MLFQTVVFLEFYISYRSILQISCNIKKACSFHPADYFYMILCTIHCSKVIFCFDLDICKEIFSLRLLSFCQDIRQDPWRFIPLDISILVDQKIHMIILQCPFILRSLIVDHNVGPAVKSQLFKCFPHSCLPPDTTRIR